MLEKPENYDIEIRRYHRKEITKDEVPEECWFYKRYLEYMYEHPELKDKDLSKEEYLQIKSSNMKIRLEKRATTISKMSKEKRIQWGRNISKGKIIRPEEAKKKTSKLISESKKNRWKLMSESERQESMKPLHDGWSNKWKNMTEDECKTKIDSLITGFHKWYDNLSDDQRSDIEKRLFDVHNEWWSNLSVEGREEFNNKRRTAWKNKSEKELIKWSNFNKNKWANKSDEEKKQWSEFKRKQWEELSDEEKQRRAQRHSDWWNNLPDDDKELFCKLRQDEYDLLPVMTKKLLTTKRLSKLNVDNKLNQKFEKSFDGYLSNHFYYIREYAASNNSMIHFWDYAIFDQNGELDCLVDLDGVYFHGDKNDYNGMQSREEYDIRRFKSTPYNTKYIIIYEKEFDKSFKYLLDILSLSYDEFVDKRFKEYRMMPFPYPEYTNRELYKSYIELYRMKCNDKYHKNINMNTRLGDRIVYHFHHSIYSDIVDLWNIDEWLLSNIQKNTIIHNYLNRNKILHALTKKSMSPGKAKMIIDRYLSDYDEIFDPFVSYGGRMLGSISLNKRYIGYESDEVLIHENENILKFLKDHMIDYDVSLTRTDARSNTGVYECMFTECNENDINILMNVYQCKKYVFVVDNKIIIKEGSL